jgi:hypothetical protein
MNERMDTSKTKVSVLNSIVRILLFVGNINLGIGALVVLWLQSMRESSTSDFVFNALLLEVGGAFITAAVTAAILSRSALLWSMGFALPLCCFGCFFAIAAMAGADPELLWVAVSGFAALCVSLLGAWLGRQLGRFLNP